MRKEVRTFDFMLMALYVILQFENVSDSNMYIMQWPAAEYCLVLGFSQYNQLSQRKVL